MNEDMKKIIIVSVITLVLFSILMCVLFLDIPLLGISSIKTIIGKYDEITQEEAQLLKEQNSYTTLTTSLENAKANYEKEKSKYESISDETINIIKEANTEENYSLEYMWIKLGNYAKKNNLELVMVEPGSTTVNQTSDATATTQDVSVVDESSSTNTTSNTNATNNSNVLKIEVTGNYIDVSDFIFEVENDTELKFKLDNISMQCVSGTTIKTIFDVKNIIINK